MERHVTKDRAIKQAVRERMEKTGEKYTEARRAVAADGPGAGEPAVEFDRQVDNLVQLGYPELAGLGEGDFRARLEPLSDRLGELPAGGAAIPFAVVVGRALVPPEASAAAVRREGKAPTSMLEDGEAMRFEPIPSVELPPGDAYLITGIETDDETRNRTPDDALALIEKAGRSPLTLDEGIAVATHFPEAVARNAGFSLPGSRAGNKRVTAWWLSKGAPKLGWCWAGNPHTWLASASCERRVGP